MQNEQLYTKQFYTQGVNNLLLSSMYALADAQCTLERFGDNFAEGDEQDNYLNAIQQQLQQVQNLLKLTQHFTEISKYEKQ